MSFAKNTVYRLVMAFAGLVLLPLGAAGQTTSLVDSLPEGVTPSMVNAGKDLFGGRGLCLTCHGPDAKGGLGPDLTDTEWLHGEGRFTEIVARILLGVPDEDSITGQSMPPKGGSTLTDQEVRAVAAYVWTLSRGGRGRASGSAGAKPIRR